ncbi:WAP four-disulfide core domain protein 2-like isoform X2 [Homarus americanus]|uniref:WAP four-disulfide core domain protein 2-like isoform X2 n=1 Tax=Homarus americanus TaxID=6706 RepID=UPI001C4595B8|nr:WAP four-disulfide core domain protein 2-like isoform X2 [Homarus americanus]XP_042237560.1 WAP four-disulfide core domain protein 2-like isoform X2 [Homarus americanus]
MVAVSRSGQSDRNGSGADVCPPVGDNGYSCNQTCESHSQCDDELYCCEVDCGKTCLTRFQAKQSKDCPPPDPDLACVQFLHRCNNDKDCRGDNEMAATIH